MSERNKRTKGDTRFRIVWRKPPDDALLVEAGATTMREHMEQAGEAADHHKDPTQASGPGQTR